MGFDGCRHALLARAGNFRHMSQLRKGGHSLTLTHSRSDLATLRGGEKVEGRRASPPQCIVQVTSGPFQPRQHPSFAEMVYLLCLVAFSALGKPGMVVPWHAQMRSSGLASPSRTLHVSLLSRRPPKYPTFLAGASQNRATRVHITWRVSRAVDNKKRLVGAVVD